MEGIFHFQGQRRLSTMAKQYTIQPCFSDNEGNTSSGDELEQEQPQLVSKKSHFSIRSESNSQESLPPETEYKENTQLDDVKLNNIIKEKRKSKLHTNTDIHPKKKTEFQSNNAPEETKGPSFFFKSAEDLAQPPKLLLPYTKEEEHKMEASMLASKRKVNNLKVVSTKMPFDPLSEIKTSDKVMEVNKNKTMENIINSHLYRCLIFSPIATESLFKRHLTLTYRGLIYAKKCLKEPSKAFLKSKLVNLVDAKPPKPKTLLLDLDETIVHTIMLMNPANSKERPDHIIKTNGEYGEELVLGLNIRPYCIEFLEKLAKYYEIFIFTASSPNYANSIINFLDPSKILINGILTRENCLQTKNGFFIKDLRVINNRELKNMIIVDNLSHSFGFQIDNGIPILEFHNDKKDRELRYLADYLMEAFVYEDLREFNKTKLRLQELSQMKIEELNI